MCPASLRHIAIACLLTTLFMSVQAQDNPYLYDPPTTLDNHVVEPTAEASAIRRYQDCPVSYATGTATVEIPLLSWQSGDASVALGLSYHTGGIKAEEDAGNVGLGWSLTGLGRISRRIVGLPDERRESYFTWPVLHDTIPDTSLSSVQAEDVLAQRADACRDIYSYDIPGYSGSFVIDENDNIKELTPSELKITFVREAFNSSLNYTRRQYPILHFTITTPNGAVYNFGDRERVRFNSNPDPLPVPFVDTDYECTVTWNLSEIVTPGASERVFITYSTARKWQRGHTREQVTRSASWINAAPQAQSESSPVRSATGPVTTFLNPLVPKSITTRTATATFSWTQGSSASLTAPEIRITGISLKSRAGNTVRTALLEYSQSLDGRYLLHRATVSAADTVLDRRTFSYQASVHEPFGDAFGFPNGKSRDNYLYESVLDINGNMSDARKADSSHVSDNSLVSIEDVTGCTTTFTYEPKTCSSSFNGRTVSASIGQRVASIRSTDNITGRYRLRRFTYLSPKFTIDLARTGIEAWIGLSGMTRTLPVGQKQSTLTATMTTSSRVPGMPLEATDIVYGRVIENVSGTGMAHAIRTRYEFDLSQMCHDVVGAGQCPVPGQSLAPNDGFSDFLGCHTTVPAGVNVSVFNRIFNPKAVTYFVRQNYGGSPLLTSKIVYEWRDGDYRIYEYETRTYKTEKRRVVPLGLHCELLKYRHKADPQAIDTRVSDPSSDVNAFIYSARPVTAFCDTVKVTRHYPDGNMRTVTTAMESYTERYRNLPTIPLNPPLNPVKSTILTEFPGDSIHLVQHSIPQIVSTTVSCGNESVKHIQALVENVMNPKFNSYKSLGFSRLPVRERWISGSGDTLELACEYGVFYNVPRITRQYIARGSRPPLTQLTFNGYNTHGMPVGGYSAQGAHMMWVWDDSDCLTSKTVGGRLNTTYTHIPLVGCTSITFPSGKKRFYSYAGSRLVSESNASTVLNRWSYSLYGTDGANCVEASTLVGNNLFRTERNYFDGFGMPVRQVKIDASGTKGSHLLSATEYDALDRPLRQTLPMTTLDAGFGDTLSFSDILSDTQTEYDDSWPASRFTYDIRPDATPAASYIPGEANYDAPTLTQRKCNNLTVPMMRCWRFYVSNSNMLTRSEYHPAGALDVSQVTDPDGRISLTFSDWRGRKILERKVLNGSQFLDTYYIYDSFGRLLAVLMPDAVPQTSQLYSQEPFSYSTNLKANAFRYTYDANGHLAEKREPGCAPVTYRYDVFGRMAFSQDADELAEGKCRAYFYDNAGRQVLTALRDDSAMPGVAQLAPPMLATFNFSAQGIGGSGYLASNIPGLSGELISANYYDLYLQHKRAEYSIFPESQSLTSTTAYGMLTGTKEAIYHHQPDGVADFDNPFGRVLLTYYTYDDEERPVNVAVSSIKEDEYATSTTYYNPAGLPTFINHVLHNAGTSQGLYINQTYDFLGRPLRTYCTHGIYNNLVLCMTRYDKYGRVASETKPTGFRSLKYDINSRVTSVSESPFSEKIEYTPGGLVSIRTEDGINGTTLRRYSYDSAARLSQITVEPVDPSHPSSPASPDVEASFAYDRNSNITALTRTGLVSNGSPVPVRATVDDLALTYSGNCLVRVTDGAPAFTAYNSYDFHDGADETLEYTYDALGRLTSDLNRGIASIEWNRASQPHRITLDNGTWLRYTFSASGRKLLDEAGHTVAPSTASALSPSSLSDDLMPGGGTVLWGDRVTEARRYTGPFELKGDTLMRINIPGGYWSNYQWHSYVNDRQGNVRAVLRGNGSVVQRTDYYPYGLPCASTSPTANAYKFAAKELETRYALNFSHHGARLYFSDLGRFASPDPLAGNTPGTSTYLFCAANPANLIDPSGMIWENYDEVQALKSNIEDRISYHSDCLKTITDEKSSAYIYHQLSITLLQNCIDYISDIQNDNRVFVLKELNSKESAHSVYLSDDKIVVEGDGSGLFVHEITHIGQEFGNLKFSNDQNNKLILSGNVHNKTLHEIEAYRAQYAMDPESLPSSPSSIKKINIKYLDGLKGGSYEFAKQYYKQIRKNLNKLKKKQITIDKSVLDRYNQVL